MGNVINLRNVAIFHASRAGASSLRHRGDMVVSGVSLLVSEGEMVYLIGRVGSGKSSLIKTLYGELPLCEGEGEVVGFDLKGLKRKAVQQLRRKIGVVFQNYQLLTDRDAFENLRYVMLATGWKDESAMRQRIDEVMNIVGLQNKLYRRPSELSGGEQQRLAIARALINNPKLLLADEPTGNLDPTSADEIMALFKRIVESGTAIVMATHNIANIEQFPSRTLRFSKGKVEEIDIKSKLGIE